MKRVSSVLATTRLRRAAVARPRAARIDATVRSDMIRDAAAQLFAERGYAGSSIADLARACGISKALMYHYYHDKEHLLADIADSYIDRLQQIVDEVASEGLPPAARLRRLIERFMVEYEHSAARHRVLVQDVKYLERAHRSRVLGKQRRVVDGFANVIAELAPQSDRNGLVKPLTMILFGMINWTFTWLRDEGRLTYSDMAPIVTDLFLAGIARVRAPLQRKAARRRPNRASLAAEAMA